MSKTSDKEVIDFATKQLAKAGRAVAEASVPLVEAADDVRNMPDKNAREAARLLYQAAINCNQAGSLLTNVLVQFKPLLDVHLQLQKIFTEQNAMLEEAIKAIPSFPLPE